MLSLALHQHSMATSESIFESLEVIETEVVENTEVKARDEEKKVANTLCSLADGRIDEEVESACEALVLARESVNIQALDLEGEEDESEVLVLRDGGKQVLVWREGKGMVFRDEGKEEETPRRRTTSRCRKNPTEWPHWLPHDWSVWRVPRTRGKSKGHVDVYYYNMVGDKFRSKKEVLFYLENGSMLPKEKKQRVLTLEAAKHDG